MCLAVWVVSIFPFVFLMPSVSVKIQLCFLGKDRGTKLLQSLTLPSFTLINPWLVVNIFPLSFLTLGRVSRCGCSIILAIVQLMPMVLALLCFVVRGFSSDLCHIKIRSVITGVRFDGSVQQEEGLSFLSPLALMSCGVDSLQLRSTRGAACCSSCCCPRDARGGSDGFVHLALSACARSRPPLLV